MEQVAILLFLYSAFFLIGSVIALFWLPLRLFFVLAFVAGGLLQVNPQFDIHSLLEYYIPIFFFIFPSVAKTFGLRFADVLLTPIYFILLPIAKLIGAYRVRRNNKKAWQMFNEFKERVDQRQEGHRRQEEDVEEEEAASRARYEQERRQRQYQEQRRQEEEQQQQQKKEQTRHEQDKEQRERRYREEQQQQQRASSRQSSYKDPYEVLGVTRDMEFREIKKKYLELLKKVAPDLVNHMDEDFKKIAHEKTIALNLAIEKIEEDFKFKNKK